jgi:hypothetical protein
VTDRILQAVYESAADDIVFIRKFPPHGVQHAPSYFGGLPRLPAELSWPYSDYIGQHISFLAQIDLASLPSIQWRSRLPAEGTLFFFANTAFDRYEPEKDKWGHVLFAPYSCVHIGKCDAPSDLMPIHGDSIAYLVKWITHEDRQSLFAPRLFPYWPVDPIIVRTFGNESPTGDTGNLAIKEARAIRAAEERRILTETFGEPIPRRSIGRYYAAGNGGPSRLGPLPPPGYPLKPIVYGEPWLPDDDWPYAWIFAEIFCVQLLNNSHRHLTHPEPHEERAHHWRARAHAAGSFSPMPAQTRTEFRAWVCSVPLEGVPPSGRKGERLPPSFEYNWVADSLVHGVDACLGYARPGERLFPEHLVPLIEARHRAFTGDEKSFHFVRHQLLGAPRAVQSATDEYGATHVLLAQFDYDPGCLWEWGDVGVLQFWITPQDLKACRFDQAIMTMEGG